MSVFTTIANLFIPAASLIDKLHVSDAERMQLQNQLAEIEARVVIHLATINSKLAIAEQEHGNLLSRSWRPLVSLIMTGLLVAMGLDIIPYKEIFVQIAGGFLGIYSIGRSFEKRK